ncbi:MAG: hypothetical protein V9E96_01355 [Chitinophagaceae bacterium]
MALRRTDHNKVVVFPKDGNLQKGDYVMVHVYKLHSRNIIRRTKG